mmetsp:Transcript_95532/g.303305  ORF Transcript_95532/g.303305 Transcript_95532/m.303305 type:complete len:293 (-) Transcript_95532:485-1363(-)
MCRLQAAPGTAIMQTNMGTRTASSLLVPSPAAASSCAICSCLLSVSTLKCLCRIWSSARLTGICALPWPPTRPPVAFAETTARVLSQARKGARSRRHMGQDGAASKAWSRLRARHGRHSVWPHGIVAGSWRSPKHRAHSRCWRTQSACSESVLPAGSERLNCRPRGSSFAAVPAPRAGQRPSRSQPRTSSSASSGPSTAAASRSVATASTSRGGTGCPAVPAADSARAKAACLARSPDARSAWPRRSQALAHMGQPGPPAGATAAQSATALSASSRAAAALSSFSLARARLQ